MRSKVIALLGVSAVVFSTIATSYTEAQSFTVHEFKRKNKVGEGKAPALGTVRYPPAIKQGETIVMFADGADPDGDSTFIDWYVNGRLFTSQSEAPYGVHIGPDIYGSLPVRVTVAVRTDHGDVSVARVAITSTAFADTYSCVFTHGDISVTTSGVVPTQTGNTGLAVSFEGKDEDTGNDVTVVASLTLGENSVSGSMTSTVGSTSKLFGVSGTATFKNDDVTVDSFTVTDSDDGAELACS